MKNLQVKPEDATHSDLYIVFEFTNTEWRLIFNKGNQQRIVSLEIGDWMGLKAEIEITKIRLDCTKNCQVYSCYEAKKQGYWFHRALLAEGIVSFVFGPSIKEVGRKKLAMIQSTDMEEMLWQLLQRVSGAKFDGRLGC